nr:flavodoxin [Prevotella sp.]
CSNDDEENIAPVEDSSGKSLVVYFSKTVPEGVDATTGATNVFAYNSRQLGATQWVAQQIADRTGADMHRITIADDYYPVTYNELADFARDEKEAGTHPVLTSNLSTLSDYKNVFIGMPVWWYTVPMPIYSFLDAYDLSGKNIMVFTTHEGSGLADAVSVIRTEEPNAIVNSSGFSTRGNQAGSQATAIAEWLSKLGF